MSTQTPTRHFIGGTHTSRVMSKLARTAPGATYRLSATIHKHGLAVLLALAAHHDADAVCSIPPGYTAAELAPFVGVSVSSVAAVLLELQRKGWLERYASPMGYRYLIPVSES